MTFAAARLCKYLIENIKILIKPKGRSIEIARPPKRGSSRDVTRHEALNMGMRIHGRDEGVEEHDEDEDAGQVEIERVLRLQPVRNKGQHASRQQ